MLSYLISVEEVEVELCSRNIEWYENLKYEIPRRISQGKNSVKRGTKIKVKIEDLMNSSHELITAECDGCGEELTNIKWQDYLKCVKEDGRYYCNLCSKNGFTKWISFEDWCYKNLTKEESDKILLRWDYELNIDKNRNILSPKNVSRTSGGLNRKGYWFKCLEHSEHESELKSISSFTSNGQTNIACNQCNTIAVTHPDFVKYLLNNEDAFKYSMGSAEKILMKCPNCGFQKELVINQMINHGFSCPRCSDGISYPEKFMFNVLEQLLAKDFKTQLSKTTFKWCRKYRYDNYIPKINCIVETHGIQHYEEVTSLDWGNLEKTQENDKKKEQLARENNINNYIVIDCRKSELAWIRDSIMDSDLPILLGFKNNDIDWLKCHEYACKSLVKITCDLWGKNKISTTIAEKLKISVSAVRCYLKQGAELGWCDYDSEEASKTNIISLHKKACKKIICLTTNEIFNSMSDASNKYNIHKTSISACCRKYKISSAGKDPFTGEKLIWMYHDEYLFKTDREIKEILNNAIKIKLPQMIKTVCLTTEEIFKSASDAGRKYNIDISSILKCCKNKINFAGKHPETKEKMTWAYYDDFILNNNNLGV